MRDNNLMKDGDWLSKDAAARDGLPPHFTDDQIRAKMAEVSHGRHPGLAEVSHGRHPGLAEVSHGRYPGLASRPRWQR